MANHAQRPKPLILAIEPDRRQAGQLSATVRDRLRAELIVAASAEPALAELGDRVPDLILLSALLRTKDEAAIAERLRLLDAAAAHVQTLTIPWLATPEPPLAFGRSALSALIGDRSSDDDQGCDPAVFAEQCAEYLAHAVSQREQRGIRAAFIDRADSAEWADVAVAKAATEQRAPMEKAPETNDPLVAAAAPSSKTPTQADDGAGIDLSAMLDECVFRQLSDAIETVTRDSASTHAPTTPSVEAWTPSSLDSEASWPAIDFAPAEKPRDYPAEKPRDNTAEQRRGISSTVAPATQNRLPAHRQLQDEWGLFDADHCDFSALLAKLDEITHVAPSLPASKSPAGSPNVNR